MTVESKNLKQDNPQLEIKPIKIKITKARDKKKQTKKIKTAIIIPDIQVGFRKDQITNILEPFHDRVCIDVALQITKHVNPDRVVFLGDNIDLPEWSSKYLVSPDFFFTTQPSLIELAWIYGQFRLSASSAKIDVIEGNHECLDDKTEVLTKEGWKFFEEIKETDLIASFNQDNNYITFDKPIALHKYVFNGNLKLINSRNVSLAITPNHRLLYKVAKTTNSFLVKEFCNINVGNNRIVLPSSGYINNDEFSLTDDEIKIGAWLCTDASLKYKKAVIYQKVSTSYKVRDILTCLNWEFREKTRYRNITHICGKKLKKPPEGAVEFYINKKHFSFINYLVPENQQLPKWVYELSSRQFAIFLDSFIDADGTRPRTAVSCVQAYGRKRILDDLQAACTQNGYRTVLREYRPTQYILSITKKDFIHIDRFKKYVSDLPYSGFIYCATTKNNTLVVRREGKVVITGNSRLNKLLVERLPQAYYLKAVGGHFPIFSMENLLDLKALDIKYHGPYPNGEVWLNENFRLVHGEIVRSQSGKTTSAIVNELRTNEACGHIHRTEMASKTVWSYEGPKVYQSWSFGTLASIKPGIVPALKGKNNWQNSIAYIEYQEGNGLATVTPIMIYKNTAIFNGRVFTARNEEAIIAHIKRNTGI